MRSNKGLLTWAGLVATGTALEVVAIRSRKSEDTLSHALRVVFWTHTKTGKVALSLGYCALGVWLVPHLSRGISGQIESFGASEDSCIPTQLVR